MINVLLETILTLFLFTLGGTIIYLGVKAQYYIEQYFRCKHSLNKQSFNRWLDVKTKGFE